MPLIIKTNIENFISETQVFLNNNRSMGKNYSISFPTEILVKCPTKADISLLESTGLDIILLLGQSKKATILGAVCRHNVLLPYIFQEWSGQTQYKRTDPLLTLKAPSKFVGDGIPFFLYYFS